MQLVLAAPARPSRPAPPTASHRPKTLLRDSRPTSGPTRPARPDARRTASPLDPDDRSIQVHACHGRARQVEVLRDAILHLLEDDPTLEPRDVIVMCPDIETFAPLIHATFGAGDVPRRRPGRRRGARDVPDRPDLRVRLADRSLRQTNPVLGVVARAARARRRAASRRREVLDLAGREPVRRRFRLDDDDLARIEDWVAAPGIRWGLDAPHRAPFKLDRSRGQHLAGRPGPDPARGDHGRGGPAPRSAASLPLDDVDSGDIDLAGPLRRAGRPPRRMRSTPSPEPKHVDGWAAAIADAADALTPRPSATPGSAPSSSASSTTSSSEATAGGRGGAARASPWPTSGRCSPTACGAARPRANFRTGHLTICTLVPMRSVPHRVVCLLGLDDGVFPRRRTRDGDDLIARTTPTSATATPGARTASSFSTPAGRRPTAWSSPTPATTSAPTSPRPPAVPVGELLDVVDRTVRGRRRRRAREPRRRPPSAAALRRPQLHAGRAGAPTRRGASTRSTSTAPVR